MPADPTRPRLAIVAGGGDLPGQLARACLADGRALFVVALEGHAEPATLPAGVATAWFRLGAAGAVLDRLSAEGVGEVVLAGRVRRPSLAELRPDWKAAQVLARIGAKALGDDGLLRAVAEVLEEKGFRVVGVQDILASLLTLAGSLGRVAPDTDARADIRRGVAVARALGAVDVGQAVVVQQGLVLGVEAIEGTDALIDRCGALRRQGPGPVLVKLRKPQQDVRLDLPALGPETVARAAAAGFCGIAAEAGGTLLLDRETAIARADAAGLFLCGIDPESP